MNKLEKLKRCWFVVNIVYRKEIRKKLLKVLIVFNGILLFMSILNNMPSMVLFLLNMYYLYNYLKYEYPEEGLKIKDRFKGMDQ
ncbi:hypothetical protein ES702_00726 [subsurface metagenome]